MVKSTSKKVSNDPKSKLALKNSGIKTQQFLAFIMKLFKHCTAHNLMKLSYLTDYLAAEKTGRPISGFRYKLYSIGPFDEKIFAHLEKLVLEQQIKSHLNYTPPGQEYVTYAFNDMISDTKFKNDFMSEISISEFLTMQDILYPFFNYMDKELTAMVYNSKPIKALGATPGGLEATGQILKLRAN